MPEPHLFEYAVIRVVPRVEREEFLNVGIIIYYPRQKAINIKYQLNEARLLALFPEVDTDEISKHLMAFECIASGQEKGGAIGRLDAASRFRWLTATRSTIIQTSKVHPGLCKAAPDKKLQKLFDQMVL